MRLRASVYIDGFNIYHSIQANSFPNELKWVSYAALAKLLLPAGSEIVHTKVFTAIGSHYPQSAARQRVWLKALEANQCEVILGRFKMRDRVCKSCGVSWVGHEEKETDVNISLHILNDCYKNSLDQILVLTNDTDLVPAVQMVRAEFPRIQIVQASIRKPHVVWDRVVDQSRTISAAMLRQALLPETVVLPSGRVLTRPEAYDPAP